MDVALALAYQRAAGKILNEQLAAAKSPRSNGTRWSRNRLIAAVRGAAEVLGTPLGIHPFMQYVGTTTSTLYRWFPRGWHSLLDEAGVETCPPGTTKRWSDEDLLAEYDRVHAELGRHPTLAELGRLATPSRSTFFNRLGGTREIRERHAEWKAQP